MTNYEVVAFYKEDKQEIAEIAERICKSYGLSLRYEKVPQMEKAISVLLGQNCVLCLLQREKYRFYRLMKYVYASNKPVLILQNNIPQEAYQLLKIPVGYLQENKEKVVWANFLQRHHSNCQIELVVPREKDENIATMIHNNVGFMENILKNSKANYVVEKEERSFEKMLVQMFQSSHSGIIFMMRPFRIFAFYYPYFIRLYRKYAHAPVLIIPRDDALYIPCH